MIASLFLTLRLETYLPFLNLQVPVLIILCFRVVLAKIVCDYCPYQPQFLLQKTKVIKCFNVSKLFSLISQFKNVTMTFLILLCKETNHVLFSKQKNN